MTKHAVWRSWERDISERTITETLRKGRKQPDRAGRTRYTWRNIAVVVAPDGNIVTVFRL